MAEYIDKEKLLISMHSNYSAPVLKCLATEKDVMFHEMCRAVIEAPAADVVSRVTYEAIEKTLLAFAENDVTRVVRCKDCCCSEEYTAADGKTYYTCDELQLTGLEPEHFCSYGERKADND